jgi:hypothetical protein
VQGELIFTLHGLQSPVPMPVLIPTLWFAEWSIYFNIFQWNHPFHSEDTDAIRDLALKLDYPNIQAMIVSEEFQPVEVCDIG